MFQWRTLTPMFRLCFNDDGFRECRSLVTVFRLVCLTTYFAIDVLQRHVYRITLIDDGGGGGGVYCRSRERNFRGSPLTINKTSDWRSLTMEVSSVALVDNG